MKLFYGWVIVGVGIVVTCVGFGAMFSLGVFLQPISEAMGWSRTGISTAALLNFLCMGVGSFFWGALSDRLGTRAVVLLGGVLLGLGHGDGEPGGDPRPVPALLRGGGRLRGGQPVRADDGDDHPLVHAAPEPRGRAGLGGARARLDDDGAARPLASSPTTTGARPCWCSAISRGSSSFPPRCSCGSRRPRRPPPLPSRRLGEDGSELTVGAGAAHTAVRRHRVHVLRVLRGALGADLPHGHPRDRPRRAGRWPRPRCSARRAWPR